MAANGWGGAWGRYAWGANPPSGTTLSTSCAITVSVALAAANKEALAAALAISASAALAEADAKTVSGTVALSVTAAVATANRLCAADTAPISAEVDPVPDPK